MSSIGRRLSAAWRAALSQQIIQCPRKSRADGIYEQMLRAPDGSRDIIISKTKTGRTREKKMITSSSLDISTPSQALFKAKTTECAKQDRRIPSARGRAKIIRRKARQLVDLSPIEPISSSSTNAKTPPHPKKSIKPPKKEQQSSCQHNRRRAQKAPPVKSKLMISNVREQKPEPRVLTEIVQEGGTKTT